jgi:hypothetical protein
MEVQKKQKMKILILINKIFLLLIGACHSPSQSTTSEQMCDSIAIVGLNRQYVPDENIKFKIINQFTKPIFLSVSLEEFHNNEWIELHDDIFKNKFSKEVNVMIIQEKEEKNIDWDTDDLPRVSLSNDTASNKTPLLGEFRFVFKWSYSPKEAFKSCPSAMITIQ